MKREHVFFLAIGLVAAAVLLVGCYMPVAPDVTPTPSQLDIIGEGMEQLGLEAAEYSLTLTAMAPVETPTTTPEPPVVTEPPTVEPTPEIVIAPAETASPPPTEAPPVAPGTEGSYVVQPGDTLYSIARRYGLSSEELALYNNITNPNLIPVGQVLRIPAGGAAIPSPQPAGGVIVHRVQPGDNLFRIALRYNMSYLYLASYNGISNPHTIYVGQEIRIPTP